MHESAEFAGHISDLSSLFLVVVDAKDELVSLKEGNGGAEVHGELEGSDDLLFEGDEGLLGNEEALSVCEESDHDVEGGMHGLFKFGGHEEASHAKSDETWSLLVLNSQVDEVSVGDADGEHEGVDLVALVAVEVLDEDDHALSLRSCDRKCLSVSGDVRADRILLAEHGLVGGLREFWCKLALDVAILAWTRWGCVNHVDGGDHLAERLLPSSVHLL